MNTHFNEHQQRAVKFAFAYLITFAFVHFSGFTARSWPLITLTVLMVPADARHHVYKRSFNRIGGTLIGAMIGIVALQLEYYVSFYAMLPLVAVGAALAAGFARHERFSYASIVIAITMAVVINAPAGDFHTAIMRISGIVFGAVMATIFSVLL